MSSDRSHLPAPGKAEGSQAPLLRGQSRGISHLFWSAKTPLFSQAGPLLPSGSLKSGTALSSPSHFPPTSMSRGPGRRCLALVADVGSRSRYRSKAERDEGVRMWLLGNRRRPGVQSEERVLGKLHPSQFSASFPISLLPRRGRESQGREGTSFSFFISGHQREKVWRWGWGWSRKPGAGNDMEREQGKMFWLYHSLLVTLGKLL